MFCTKCGQQLEDNANFCTKCGNPLSQTFVSDEQSIIKETNITQNTFIQKHFIILSIISGIISSISMTVGYNRDLVIDLFDIIGIHNQILKNLLDFILLAGGIILLFYLFLKNKKNQFQLIGLIGIPLFCFILYILL